MEGRRCADVFGLRGCTNPQTRHSGGLVVLAIAVLVPLVVEGSPLLAQGSTLQGGQQLPSPTRTRGDAQDWPRLGSCTDTCTVSGYYDGSLWSGDCGEAGVYDGLATLGWPAQTILVEKFDRSLGELQSVLVEVSGDAESSYCVENLTPDRCVSFKLDEFVTLTVQPPGFASACSEFSVDRSFLQDWTELGGFDGSPDCVNHDPLDADLPSTGSCGPLVPDHHYGRVVLEEAGVPQACTITDSLELWTQCGSGQMIPFISTTTSDVVVEFVEAGVGISTFEIEARVRVDVTYTYCSNQRPGCTSSDPEEVDEDSSVVINLLDHVADPDGFINCSSFELIEPPKHGQLGPITPSYVECEAIDCFPSFPVDYTPDPDYCGPDSFSIMVRDNLGLPLEVPCEILIHVNPVNDPPFCVEAPVFSTCADTPIDIDFCQYIDDIDDEDACNSGFGFVCNDSAILEATSSCGSLDHLFDGTYRFTPNLGHVGLCTVNFTGKDTQGAPAHCQLDVEVLPANQVPIAVNDTTSTCEDSPVTIQVLANDMDPDGLVPGICTCVLDPSTVQIIDWDHQASSGPPGVNLDGTVTFTPAPGYCGPAWFEYTVSDSNALGVECSVSNIATVSVDVLPINDPPVAVNDFVTTVINEAILIPVCANDFDLDDLNGGACGCMLDCTTVEVVPGSWDDDCVAVPPEPDGLGNIRFVPKPDFLGQCCFEYRVRDDCAGAGIGCGGMPLQHEWDTATVCVQVRPDCPPSNLRRPASLLLFPEYNNLPGALTYVTVTNTSDEREIDVHFQYVNGEDCTEFDRVETLTANDTLTLLTGMHNPNPDRGYLYVYAQCEGEPVVFNWLVGNEILIDGVRDFSSTINPVAFRGIGEGGGGISCGENGENSVELILADVNQNGQLDLDGIEYDPVPERILIPRFLGQKASRSSEIILIALSGGAGHQTRLDFQVFNDNEEGFSSEFEFQCWDRVPLAAISNVFNEVFLQTATANNPLEILGDPNSEAGWFWINGDVAVAAGQDPIEDPAFYAVLIEDTGMEGYVGDLPFGECSQDNGSL